MVTLRVNYNIFVKIHLIVEHEIFKEFFFTKGFSALPPIHLVKKNILTKITRETRELQ